MGGVVVQPVAVMRDDTDLSKPNRIRIVVAEGRNREVSGRAGAWLARREAAGPAGRQACLQGASAASSCIHARLPLAPCPAPLDPSASPLPRAASVPATGAQPV